jgi:hypothetical protein
MACGGLCQIGPHACTSCATKQRVVAVVGRPGRMGSLTPFQRGAKIVPPFRGYVPQGLGAPIDGTAPADVQADPYLANIQAQVDSGAITQADGDAQAAQYKASQLSGTGTNYLPAGSAGNPTGATSGGNAGNLSGAQQAAIDAAAINAAASVTNTAIAGVVAASKGTQLQNTANAANAAAAGAAGRTGTTAPMSTNAKIAIAGVGLLAVGGLAYAMMGKPRRRRR